MARRIATKQERCTLSSLKRWNPGVPEEVLAAEARRRFEARVLQDHEGGELQTAVAKRLGYSLTQVERILQSARRTKKAGAPSPLDAHFERNYQTHKAEAEAKAASETKAPTPQLVTARTFEEFDAEVAFALLDGKLVWGMDTQPTTRVAGEDWVRSVYRSATGVVVEAKPPEGKFGPTLRLEMSDASARWLGGHVLAALDVKHTGVITKLSQEPPPEPIVRILDGMLKIEGANGETTLGFGDGGVSLSELSRLLSAHA